MSSFARARDALRRLGPAGVMTRIAEGVRDRVRLRERHYWYELTLAPDRMPRALPDGLELAPLRDDELHLLARVHPTTTEEARERCEAGGEAWMVRESGEPAFACWIFWRRTPMLAARDGWLELEPRTVCLEDSVTAASHRGNGVAPAAWSQIADRVAERGAERIVTKVGEPNTASRNAVRKAGFREVAVQEFRRVGVRTRVTVEVLDPAGEWLAGRLRR